MAVRVLVVEDDEVSREVLTVLLEGAGYAVEAVDSGEAALRYLSEVTPLPEVVLADWQMPGVAGEELARRMREVGGAATTLLAMSGSEVEGGVTGFDGFLLKPFAMEEFAAAVAGGAVVAERGGMTAVLDETVYAKLAGAMRRGKVEELYAMCLGDAERRVEEMRLAASSGDGDAYRREAHAIQGGCGMVGAREMQMLGLSMEERGLRDDYVASLDQFMMACGRLRRILAAHEIREQTTEVSGESAR